MFYIKLFKKNIVITTLCLITLIMLTGCNLDEGGAYEDTKSTIVNADKLQLNQPTPTDIDYSLERYNLIRRAYWVNGQREKANALPCEIEKPLGYVTLFTQNSIVGQFIVDGKISSLNSFLTPDSQYYEETGESYHCNKWLADVDGSYGENDSGIFFFTPDGKYIEWNGTYLYSDLPFEVDSPVLVFLNANPDPNYEEVIR